MDKLLLSRIIHQGGAYHVWRVKLSLLLRQSWKLLPSMWQGTTQRSLPPGGRGSLLPGRLAFLLLDIMIDHFDNFRELCLFLYSSLNQ